jgi:hypothetical protein
LGTTNDNKQVKKIGRPQPNNSTQAKNIGRLQQIISRDCNNAVNNIMKTTAIT